MDPILRSNRLLNNRNWLYFRLYKDPAIENNWQNMLNWYHGTLTNVVRPVVNTNLDIIAVFFGFYGPEDQKNDYHKRPLIEAVNSFLKTQYSMAMNKVRGLGNVAAYALFSILCLVLNREAAENIGKPEKAVSPTYFNT